MRKSIERVFWFIAAVAFAIYGLSIVETRLYQLYLDWQFTEALQPPPLVIPSGVSAAAAVGKTKPGQGEPLGRLEIPSIELSAMVAEGVASSTLRRGVGHVPGTALPGGRGNVGLSAHRDTFFRHLGELQKGDVISITTVEGTFDYIIESSRVVDADESAALRDIGRPTLTLVTCYPFHYVGPAPKRFVVHAGLVEHEAQTAEP
jgi:sortase A